MQPRTKMSTWLFWYPRTKQVFLSPRNLPCSLRYARAECPPPSPIECSFKLLANNWGFFSLINCPIYPYPSTPLVGFSCLLVPIFFFFFFGVSDYSVRHSSSKILSFYSTIVCCQPIELIWGFGLINYSIYTLHWTIWYFILPDPVPPLTSFTPRYGILWEGGFLVRDGDE